ncbi:hypothetical protein RB653_009823 [Dictyostelium firmibasis]|uniref:Uncharacterized protein n=1 Tax=Dictyostelium firmibasis TaxID=79012 RepID=A0AAN7TS84_9MYCE
MCDPCQVPIQVSLIISCGSDPSRFEIYNDLYYFDSIEVTPYVEAINDIDSHIIIWKLKNGVNYTISYRYKNCSNYIFQSFLPQGMYYELLSEPLCPTTLFNYTVYNWGNDGSSFNFTDTPSSILFTSNQMGSCFIVFTIPPKSDSKSALENGAIKISNPTCGFNNGSISIDLTKGYSNYRLFFFGKQKFNQHHQVFSMWYQWSLNSTNVFAYFPSSYNYLTSGNWSHQKLSLGGSYTYFGYYYYIDFSTNSTDPFQLSCLLDDSIHEDGYSMTNNVLSVPYNKNLYIYDKTSNSIIYYSTYFTSKPSYTIVESSNVEVKLNYNSSYPITYELVGTKLSNNNGKFINLSPKDYQLKITITDRMCPVTLSKTFTVKLISPPSTYSSEELSTSSFAQTNLLLLLSILILTIIFL